MDQVRSHWMNDILTLDRTSFNILLSLRLNEMICFFFFSFFYEITCITLFAEMYEISPYATFSVPGRENRSVTTATLDYTMQFKTFGHLENEDINTIDYERSSVDFER